MLRNARGTHSKYKWFLVLHSYRCGCTKLPGWYSKLHDDNNNGGALTCIVLCYFPRCVQGDSNQFLGKVNSVFIISKIHCKNQDQIQKFISILSSNVSFIKSCICSTFHRPATVSKSWKFIAENENMHCTFSPHFGE